MIFAVSGAIIGLLASGLLSRSMSAPLTELADGARSIGAGKFDQRVPVMGSDEVREVATAFKEMAAGLDQAEQLRRNLVADSRMNCLHCLRFCKAICVQFWMMFTHWKRLRLPVSMISRVF